ncbi:hypothetical protein evm_001800 [Chilo suppressalis]|nr:hypothetical protein evm_001800 [Chilo suppressalis]
MDDFVKKLCQDCLMQNRREFVLFLPVLRDRRPTYHETKGKLSERIAETVISVSANVSEEDTKRWFHNFEFCPKENNYFNIYQNPSRVFNGDESNFQLYPKSGKIISLRGERDVYEVDHAAAKTVFIVLFTFCANGDITPPLVLFPNKRFPNDKKSSVPNERGIGLSCTG